MKRGLSLHTPFQPKLGQRCRARGSQLARRSEASDPHARCHVTPTRCDWLAGAVAVAICHSYAVTPNVRQLPLQRMFSNRGSIQETRDN